MIENDKIPDNVSVFERYASKAKEITEQDNISLADVAGTEKPVYQAVGMVKSKVKQTRIFIEYADGTKNTLPYSHLLETPCTSSNHLMLWFNHCIISLEGEGIEALLEPFADQQIRYIRCYNSKRFQPPEDGALIIETLTYESMKDLAG